MRVIARTNVCIASGACVLACSEVFDQRDSDGVVKLLQEHPSLALFDKVRHAVEMCPSQALLAKDEENRGELTLETNDEDEF